MAGSSGRGIVGRIWEVVSGLLSNSDEVKSVTDQMEFVDGKLRTTGEDGSGGGGGDLQLVIDELIELNSKVSLDDTLDLINDGIAEVEINTAGTLSELQYKNFLLQVDTVAKITYLGYAQPGTATTSVTWAIKKIDETGSDASITWADGNRLYDNIWNDRLTLIYS